MNFFKQTLSSLTGSSIPYTIKEKLIDPQSPNPTELERNSIWTLYDGINPKDNSQVSIFEFNLRDPSNNLKSNLARNAFKKLKLIKYPGVVSTIDFFDNDTSLYIVTEKVVPLFTYLKGEDEQISQDAKVNGVYQIAKTLSFINDSCNATYLNLNMFNSVVVNLQGDWKLFGFELVSQINENDVYAFKESMPGFRQFAPPEETRNVKVDSYRLGKFISCVFDDVVPSRLSPIVRRLGSNNANARPTPTQYMKELESWHAENPIIRFNEEINELKFSSSEDKLLFFKQQLPNYLQNETGFPSSLLKYKLLPELISQYNQLSKIPTEQETLSIMLNLIIKFGIKLPPEDFHKTIKPIITTCFCSTDRAIRLILLSHLPQYYTFLTDSEIQSQIFNNLISGFQDTNFMIRETTLKSITIIIDKISVKQVNQDLLRILAKSQMDPKPSIRVNTLILIIKISSKIYSNSRNNVLITALAKSLRDSFTPCKMTALHGFETLLPEFSMEEICMKILGNLAIALMDKKSTKVRNEARRIFQVYLQAVESYAGDLDDLEEDEDAEEREFYNKFGPTVQEQAPVEEEIATTNEAVPSLWGAVSKLASFGGSGQLNKDFNNSTPDLSVTPQPPQQVPVAEDIKQSDTWGEFDDGWNQEEPEQVEIVKETKKLNITRKPQPIARQANTKHSSRLKLGAKPTKPKVKLNLKFDDDEEEADGWGDGW
ncbi:N-terminal kinase-like protein [Spathaspora sp. JA1]|nr:N-terminal kinase-like protein [Spathaspora sp. JA1]